MQILIRCSKPGELASKMFEQEHVVEARIHKDGAGVLNGVGIESVAPADDDVNSLLSI